MNPQPKTSVLANEILYTPLDIQLKNFNSILQTKQYLPVVLSAASVERDPLYLAFFYLEKFLTDSAEVLAATER